jgi:hypothetical protein
MNHLGIDVATCDVKRLTARLANLKTTHEVHNGGAYHADPSYSQVHLITTMTEEELDDWLYRVNHGADYVGTFTMQEPEEMLG